MCPAEIGYASSYMAKHYNNDVRAWTLMHAILPWAESVIAQRSTVQDHGRRTIATAKVAKSSLEARGAARNLSTKQGGGPGPGIAFLRQ